MERAKEGVKDTSDAFLKLSATLEKESVEAWGMAAEKARVERGESLKIYDVNLAQGVWDCSGLHSRRCCLLTLALQHRHKLKSGSC